MNQKINSSFLKPRKLRLISSKLVISTCTLLLFLYLCISKLTLKNSFFQSNTGNEFDLQEILSGLKQDDWRITNFIKTHHLFEPTSHSVKYNLTNSSHLLGEPSEGQTSYVKIILKNKINGFFVETGAHDGEIMSNTLALERDYNWTGILIEPQPIEFKNLQNKNRKAWTSNVCISPQNQPIQLEFLQRADGFTIGSRLGQRSKETFGYLFTPLVIQCFPIFSIISSLNVTQVDFFSLDVEGIEFEVLKTIPWDQIQFKVISVEVQFLKEQKITLKRFMDEKGYNFVDEFYLDYIFAHKSIEFDLNEIQKLKLNSKHRVPTA